MDDPLQAKFGTRTVRENLDTAVAQGKLRKHPDGRWSLPQATEPSWYLHVMALPLPCRFFNEFLFRQAYAGSAVPFGCRNCFKVKVVPAHLRGLVALRDLLEATQYHAKCGVDLYNPYSQDVYAGYVYLDGLTAARAAWRDLRGQVDAHPDLGPDVRITIKRGCSNFEAACGPSDQWSFREGMAELEETLQGQFHREPAPPQDYRLARMSTMVRWLQVAYDLRDDTYLDFTGGRPLHRATMSYDPE
jgi:hypothetical protein